MEELTFEQKLKRVNEIAQILESNNASLDESLKLFNEATALLNDLEQIIKSAKENIENSGNLDK